MTPPARILTWVVFTLAAVLASHGEGRAEPLDRLDQIQPAILRCWEPDGRFDGYALTVRFSLKRSGALNGEPRITYANLPGAPERDRLFVASVLAAIARCLPLPITDGLGGAIAGRPFTITFALARRA